MVILHFVIVDRDAIERNRGGFHRPCHSLQQALQAAPPRRHHPLERLTICPLLQKITFVILLIQSPRRLQQEPQLQLYLPRGSPSWPLHHHSSLKVLPIKVHNPLFSLSFPSLSPCANLNLSNSTRDATLLSPFHPKLLCSTETDTQEDQILNFKMDALSSALKPILQPITHNLPSPIRDFGESLIGDKCYKSLALNINLKDTECLKLAVSKALGIGIVGASAVVKVPQIIKLVRSQSASGVSFLSYLLETSSLLTSLAYNFRNKFPFSTYGESALILGQNVIITVLVLNYSGRPGLAAFFVAMLGVAVVSLFDERILNMGTLSYLQAGAGVVGAASKLPQILTIWQEGGTGQLSAFAVSFAPP